MFFLSLRVLRDIKKQPPWEATVSSVTSVTASEMSATASFALGR